MVIAQGEIWWANLAEPNGSAPGFRRPVVVIQGDSFNRSRIATVVCFALTSNLKLADAPGNVALPPRTTGLDRESVANVSQIVTLDKVALEQRTGKLTPQKLGLILDGIDVVLGR
jgi:mRNA interferase MazF